MWLHAAWYRRRAVDSRCLPPCPNRKRLPTALELCYRVLLILIGAVSLALGVFAIVVSCGEGVAARQAFIDRAWHCALTNGIRWRPPLHAQHVPMPLIPRLQVAPLLPPLAHPWLASVQRDRYYQLLLPLTVPVTIAAITLNWFSMKLFKHNS